jgi:hypothetical protein
MRLGTPGVAGDAPNNLTEPNDVITAPNGDIFVAEAHTGQNLERMTRSMPSIRERAPKEMPAGARVSASAAPRPRSLVLRPTA